MQLELLDRVAGCTTQAAQMAECWERHQELAQQLQDLTAMGGPEQRQLLEDLVDSVRTASPSIALLCCQAARLQPTPEAQTSGAKIHEHLLYLACLHASRLADQSSYKMSNDTRFQ